MSACKRCRQRGKTWPGDDPKCAFEAKSGRFDKGNWNCATMNALRSLVDPDDTPWDAPNVIVNLDERIGVLAVPEDVTFKDIAPAAFLVLAWYKRRGRVGEARIMDSDGVGRLTLRAAEAILDTAEG